MTKKQIQRWRKKCREYARFLKDDFDFDYEYILRLLRYKLQRTRCAIATGSTLGREKTAADIQKVEELLRKVLEHDYDSEAHKQFNKKYGKPKMVTKPHSEHTVQLEFIYKNGKPATAAMRAEQRGLYEKAFAKRKADLKQAFDLMAENIWGWWV